MPVARSGNLEIHVAVVIFGASDVGEDGVLCRLRVTRPMAMPPTCAASGTPASINASEAPQTVACELEPFDSRMSLTTRMV